MTIPMIQIDDEIREMTKEEQAARTSEIAANKAIEIATKAEVEAKATAKAALLDKLGITEDEAKLLLG
jgi:hypothetical protein